MTRSPIVIVTGSRNGIPSWLKPRRAPCGTHRAMTWTLDYILYTTLPFDDESADPEGLREVNVSTNGEACLHLRLHMTESEYYDVMHLAVSTIRPAITSMDE